MNSQNEEQKQQQKAKELPPPPLPPPLSEVDQERARLQEELKRRLIVRDTAPWADDISSCRYMAGLDVSYEKDDYSPPGSATRCAAALVILDTDDWSLVYQDVLFGEARAQYAAGFLAFREIDLLLALVERLKAAAAAAQSQRESSKSSSSSSPPPPPPPPPPPTPDVWLIDGNGVMHPRGLGLASHFGVLVDQPTVGVSKNPYFFDDSHFEGGEGGGRGRRVDRVAFKQQLARRLLKRGDCLPITNGADGSSTVVGVALKVQDAVAGPVYVSVGHRVSLETAIAVVLRGSRRYKNPEPLRQADMISRQALRKRKKKEEKEKELMRMNKNVTDLKALKI